LLSFPNRCLRQFQLVAELTFGLFLAGLGLLNDLRNALDQFGTNRQCENDISGGSERASRAAKPAAILSRRRLLDHGVSLLRYPEIIVDVTHFAVRVSLDLAKVFSQHSFKVSDMVNGTHLLFVIGVLFLNLELSQLLFFSRHRGQRSAGASGPCEHWRPQPLQRSGGTWVDQEHQD
jgi:hypothetical protein